jgi:hypothetical protein
MISITTSSIGLIFEPGNMLARVFSNLSSPSEWVAAAAKLPIIHCEM